MFTQISVGIGLSNVELDGGIPLILKKYRKIAQIVGGIPTIASENEKIRGFASDNRKTSA